MFKRSPSLTYLYGALDTTPPPPKVSSFALLVFKFSPALVFIPGEEEQASKAANQGERSGRHSGHDHARGLLYNLVNINIGIIRIILVNMAKHARSFALHFVGNSFLLPFRLSFELAFTKRAAEFFLEAC